MKVKSSIIQKSDKKKIKIYRNVNLKDDEIILLDTLLIGGVDATGKTDTQVLGYFDGLIPIYEVGGLLLFKRIQIPGVISLGNATGARSIDFPTTFYCRSIMDFGCPPQEVRIGVHVKKFLGVIQARHN